MLQPLNLLELKSEFLRAKPFPYIKIDNFLKPEFASEVADAFPQFEEALTQGKTFNSVNEKKKVQITDSRKFPSAIARLNELLASHEFLADLSYVSGMPDLIADDELVGGGMHITGPGGRLDVHIDFNYLKERKLHRRLNILVYLNRKWDPKWGGDLQLWDREVKNCEAAFAPIFNRCVVFETSNISYHGVVPVAREAPFPRQSFAAYYYTREAPPFWTGEEHSTIFKARPEEKAKGMFFMPMAAVRRNVESTLRTLKHSVRTLLGR